MKIITIDGRYHIDIILPVGVITKLPKTVTLAASVQYIDALPDLTKQLAKHGISVTLFKGMHSKHPGQIIGCDLVKDAQGAEAFLYIGDGLFHPKTLLFKTKKSVHCYFPYTDEYLILTEKDVEDILRKQQAARIAFLMAQNIGILVTTKYGQTNLKAALAIKQQLKGKKTVVIFLGDVLDWNDLENYPFIDAWMNTMCPRISYDDVHKFRKPVIDISEAIELLKTEYPSFSFGGLLAAREKELVEQV